MKAVSMMELINVGEEGADHQTLALLVRFLILQQLPRRVQFDAENTYKSFHSEYEHVKENESVY